MIDVKEIFESVLLNEMGGGRPVRLAWFKDDGSGAEVLVVGASRNQVKTMLFFNKLFHQGRYDFETNVHKLFKDDVLQFQDKKGNEVELSKVKIGSFDGSNNNSTLGSLYAGIHG